MKADELGWEVFSVDNFELTDRYCVAEARGVGLFDGLIDLWRRSLREGLRDDGNRTFTGFVMTWDGGRTDVGVQPFDNHDLARLRAWVCRTPGLYEGTVRPSQLRLFLREDTRLLRAIAAAHLRLLERECFADSYGWAADSAAGRIRAAASSSATPTDLEAALRALR